MRVSIDKGDCVIEKSVTAKEAAQYKAIHQDACVIVLEEGDVGYVAPAEPVAPVVDESQPEPQPESLADEALPAPGAAVTKPAGVPRKAKK